MRKLDLNGWEIYQLDATRFALDGGAMFGVVPRVLWERKIKPDERNRIPMATHPLLIKTDDSLVLIDTGMGTGWDEKFRDIYAVEERDLFEGTDFGYEDVDVVIATHLHFDHMAGAVDSEGKLLFENADIYVNSFEMADALFPHARSRASYVAERIHPLRDRVVLVEGTREILPGITMIQTGGHTRGHSVVLVEKGDRAVLFLADLVPTVHHVHYPYIMAYDLYPVETLQKKYEIYQEAVKYGWILAFEHDREGRMGTLYIESGRPALQEI